LAVSGRFGFGVRLFFWLENRQVGEQQTPTRPSCTPFFLRILPSSPERREYPKATADIAFRGSNQGKDLRDCDSSEDISAEYCQRHGQPEIVTNCCPVKQEEKFNG
jgi:hypothetical protein